MEQRDQLSLWVSTLVCHMHPLRSGVSDFPSLWSTCEGVVTQISAVGGKGYRQACLLPTRDMAQGRILGQEDPRILCLSSLSPNTESSVYCSWSPD